LKPAAALDNIRVVLVETSHSGNIGSAARAMKTMGLSALYLVAPRCKVDEQSQIGRAHV
jgi:tRNA C32,U32 (ribose-2'-O)-methylase TrmJ